MEKDYSINISPNDIKCVNCIYAAGNAFKTFCLKYKNKPLEVLYKSAKCPQFEEDFDEVDEGDLK